MRRWITRNSASRPSFTITELLIVMMFIALLATMTLFGLHGVMEESRAARTRSQMDKLNQLLMDRWDAYRTRPVRVAMVNNANVMAFNRLTALRELMRMEMPDRITDVLDNPVFLSARPALSRRYLNRATPGWTTLYQESECLYMILASMQDGDTNGLEFLASNEIADLDGDGMREILDAWGTPIVFLRWPAGARTPLQLGDTNPADGDAGASADPFDPLRRDPRWFDGNGANDPFALFPMVVSAGANKAFGIGTDDTPNIHYNATVPPNDPYMTFPSNAALQMGSIINAAQAADNISNHVTGTE